LVDLHKPKESDIDATGSVNVGCLKEEATKLFAKLKNETTFVNFCQLAQVANQFGDAWGFVVSTQNSFHLKCFCGKTSVSAVSPSHQRSKSSLKGDCPFAIMSTCDPTKRKELRHRQPTHLRECNFTHNCNPGIAEARLTKKAAGAVHG